MESLMICQVAVSAASYAIDKPYTYGVPPELIPLAKAGMRCEVPFGAGNRRSEGVLLRVGEGAPVKGMKYLTQLLDEQPVVDEHGLRLALWMHDRYYCTVYEAVRAMLPAGLYYALRDVYRIAPQVTMDNAEALCGGNPAQTKVLQLLLSKGGSLERQKINAAFEKRSPHEPLKKLLEKGLITVESGTSRAVGDKVEQVATLVLSPEEALGRLSAGAKAGRSVVQFLAEVGSASLKDIQYFTGAGRQSVKKLEEKEIVTLFDREVFRRVQHDPVEPQPEPTLNEEQQRAYVGISWMLDQNAPSCALLYGVTGSGKTQVYLKLIHRVLREGKTALMLVPEIALTPQMLRRFEAQFGERVAVLHSALSAGERYDEWKRARSGRAQVVIGTRSAIFAPLKDLALIILDEEQEGSYKSEQSPRYHARDIARFRCKQENAVLVLGSATPCVESMYQAKRGRYQLFPLTQRYNAQSLPEVCIADMKQELRDGNRKSISRVLQQRIAGNLSRGEQTILFLNRRGASRMVVCPDCGYTLECPNCSVKLTYHRDNGRMMCHYCGYSTPEPRSCDQCGGQLITSGVGIQQVEQELQELFPNTPVLRMDADTVSASNTHAHILARFEQERVPILIGTQMVTKGLDFENVTLVGVIDADVGAFSDSYRAAERGFSLLTQVVGRAGRGSKQGTAVLQTFSPKNDVIRRAAQQDYDGFYSDEIQLRQLRGFPPFLDLFVIRLQGICEGDVVNSALLLREGLLAWRDSPVFASAPFGLLGPAPEPVVRVMGRYRYTITVLCKEGKTVRQMLATLQKAFLRDKRNNGVSMAIDLNPLD